MKRVGLLEQLKASLEEHEDRNAFCIEDTFFSYRDVSDHVASIMHQLGACNNLIHNKRVAVVCTNEIGTYCSLLAIWFSGCAYIPLGLHNPVERNLAILGEADIDIIVSTIPLTDERYSSFKIITPALENIDTHELKIASEQEDDLAYILFTSGSTGVPKGVPISLKNISSFIRSFDRSGFDIVESDRCLQMFELTFDVSISSYLMPLLKGACVYTVPSHGIRYMQVLKLLQQYKLTSIQIVPSIIRLGKPLLSRLHCPDVKACILTGEATTIDLLPIWKSVIPNARIYNFYGPTETTIYCSSYQVAADSMPKSYNGMLAIGASLSEVELLIVDESFKETSPGEKGELLIGGSQVTTGYLNLPEKNKDSFLRLFRHGSDMLFYKSGDMCYRDETGDIYYCGRFDNQVKVQGFRIELSEIEVAVRNGFSINSVVIPVLNKSNNTELILVLEKSNTSKESVIEHLKNRLPEYMIPVKVLEMDIFPVNSNGKTDRNKIKTMIHGNI